MRQKNYFRAHQKVSRRAH